MIVFNFYNLLIHYYNYTKNNYSYFKKKILGNFDFTCIFLHCCHSYIKICCELTSNMVFMCQKDSFLREYKTKVKTCGKATLETTVNGKKTVIDGYEVKLEDTILFPEGGGQPSDQGLLNNVEVLQVRRDGEEAVHFTNGPLPVNSEVHQVLNWERRFDHMQQHSGQHLLSAILERDYGYKTDSWWLGEEVSYVEADTASFSKEDIEKTENTVNEYIRQHLPVAVQVYKQGHPDLDKASTRGLPEDHKGDIRVICIGDLDANMCCGTHVNNLSQLQMIKILYAEKSKRKNKTNIYFLVGNRVLNRLSECFERETKMTALLNNAANQHVELVEKLQKSVKNMNKSIKDVIKEIANAEACKLKEMIPPVKFYTMHRKEGDVDFINHFIRVIDDTKTLLFLTCGDDKNNGTMVLHGEPQVVSDLGPKLCELLNGKGAGKGNRFQAKVTSFSNRQKCDELINSYFAAKEMIN